MMSKIDEYRIALKSMPDPEVYLLANSGLPGPRGNLELAQAAVDVLPDSILATYRLITPEQAPTNTPGEFLAFCGVFGLGKRISTGEKDLFDQLRVFASDPRWRLREAVAMALQSAGDVDMDGLLQVMEGWVTGNWLEKRAVAAALAEPRLLSDPQHVRRFFDLLDQLTQSVLVCVDRKEEAFQSFRKTMGYAWSVAAAALPAEGLPRLARWFPNSTPDVRWIIKENLKKNRLIRIDEAWVRASLDSLNG